MLDGAINYIATEFGRIAWRENGAGRPLLLPQRYWATPSNTYDAGGHIPLVTHAECRSIGSEPVDHRCCGDYNDQWKLAQKPKCRVAVYNSRQGTHPLAQAERQLRRHIRDSHRHGPATERFDAELSRLFMKSRT